MKETLAGLILAAFTFIVSTSAQERPPEPDGYRMEDYRAPVPATLAGVRVLTTAEAERDLASKDGRVHRRNAPRAKTAKSSRRHGLARQAAAQHSRQRVAARHRLRKAGGGDGRLSAARARPRDGGQHDRAGGGLLPGRLLDVLECGKANPDLRLLQRCVVPRRNGWLGTGRPGLSTESQPEPRAGEAAPSPH